MLTDNVNIVECPRDAMQGIKHFVTTDNKIAYINKLLKSNLFEYIDFGSFVSPKVVPQMRDSKDVLDGLIKCNSTKLLAIVANKKGAEIANKFKKIDYIGYPFSISETFQRRNGNSSITDSYLCVQDIIKLISSSRQELVIYISMAFGNPYGDIWKESLVFEWLEKLAELGIKRFSIADTTGEAGVEQIKFLFSELGIRFPNLDFSIHLHSKMESALLKINAAFDGGCRRFEGAFLGYGGCPFAQDDLVGNVPTELLLDKFSISDYQTIEQLMYSFQTMIANDRL